MNIEISNLLNNLREQSQINFRYILETKIEKSFFENFWKVSYKYLQKQKIINTTWKLEAFNNRIII